RVVGGQREARGVPHDVVVRQHPGARRADLSELVKRLANDISESFRIPRGHQVREVERLMHLVRTHPERGLLERRQPGLSAQRTISVIFCEDLMPIPVYVVRSEEHTSELQSRENLVCRLLLEKNN